MSRRILLSLGALLVLVGGCDRDPVGPADVRQADPTPDAVGELFELNTRSDEACEDPEYQTARVEAISDHAVVASDVENPAGGFSEGDYQAFAQQFDDVIAPLAEHNFGEWTNLGGGRVVLFFTKEVNRLTEADADAFVAGFFFARDLFTRAGTGNLGACAHSNERELLYLLVPDPDGEFGRAQDRDGLRRFMPGTIIHELQHLINASRRLHIVPRGGDWQEETWLNEALSHTAEELLFYHETDLEPGQDLAPDARAPRPWEAEFRDHQAFNFFRLHEFLEAPDEGAPYHPIDELATRGAAWSFLRYLTDRLDGTPAELYRGLVDSPHSGIPNLAEAAGGAEPFFRGLSRWSVAVYGDGRVDGLEDPYRDMSWDHGAVWSAYGEGSYPIRARSLEEGGGRSTSVEGGGSAYFRFSVPAGETGAVEVKDPDSDAGGSGSLADRCEETVEPGAVGAAVEIEAAEVFCVEASGGLSDPEYVLVVTAVVAGDEDVERTVRSENTGAVDGPPTPVLAEAEERRGAEPERLHGDPRFDRELRERERQQLGHLVEGADAAALTTGRLELPEVPVRLTLLRTR